MKKILWIVTISLFALTSCNKDDDCETNVNTVSGTYLVTAVKYKATPASAEEDQFATFPACVKDDLFKLNSNGSFEYQDAGAACSGSYTDTWSLSGSSITIDGELYTISGFDCKTLTVYADNYNVAGDRITVTFVKQ